MNGDHKKMYIIEEGRQFIKYKCERCYCVFECTPEELKNLDPIKPFCPRCGYGITILKHTKEIPETRSQLAAEIENEKMETILNEDN